MVVSFKRKLSANFRPGVLAAAGAIAAGVLFGGTALAMDCATPKEHASFDVRVLQSKLMVAAFMCDARSEYNAFVTRYKPSLRQNGKEVTGYFRRRFSADGRRRLDRFVTALANEASIESNRDRQRFCAEARSVMRQLDRQGTASLDPVVYDGFVSRSPTSSQICRMAAR